MNLTTINLKDSPEIARVIRAAFPNYKKHKAYLSKFSTGGKYINSYWDGGSRDVYALVSLATGKTLPLPTSTHPCYDCRGASAECDDVKVENGNIILKALPENVVLVMAGTFMGKPQTASIYVREENLTKFIA